MPFAIQYILSYFFYNNIKNFTINWKFFSKLNDWINQIDNTIDHLFRFILKMIVIWIWLDRYKKLVIVIGLWLDYNWLPITSNDWLVIDYPVLTHTKYIDKDKFSDPLIKECLLFLQNTLSRKQDPAVTCLVRLMRLILRRKRRI